MDFVEPMEKIKQFFRMSQWLLFSLGLYAVAMILLAFNTLPQVQVVTWKLANATIAAWVGYRIDKSLFKDCLDGDSDPRYHIRRAIIVAATVLAVAMGA